jgi:hypothetical protein
MCLYFIKYYSNYKYWIVHQPLLSDNREESVKEIMVGRDIRMQKIADGEIIVSYAISRIEIVRSEIGMPRIGMSYCRFGDRRLESWDSSSAIF